MQKQYHMLPGKFRWLYVFLCVIGSMFPAMLWGQTAKASQEIVAEGDRIVFRTLDTKAVYSTTWREVGFTIRRDRSYGNPLKDEKVVYLPLGKPSREGPYTKDPGKVLVEFEYSREVIDAALQKAGLGTTEEEDSFYMNGVFAVKRNGVDDAQHYWTKSSIMNAAPWRNPNDFEEHFDIHVSFPVQYYPVKAECRTSQNIVLKQLRLPKAELKKGEVADAEFPEQIRKDGGKYELYRSYWINPAMSKKKMEDYRKKDGKSLEAIRKRSVKVPQGGVFFVGLYREKIKIEEKKVSQGRMQKELEPRIETDGSIRSMHRGEEEFDAEEGIPSSEMVYTEGSVPDRLYCYDFKKKTGEKKYRVTVKRTYHLTWEEEEEGGEGEDPRRVSHSSSTTVSKNYWVVRKYGYWYVEDFRVYLPEILMVRNNIFLPGADGLREGLTGKKEILGMGIQIPLISYKGYATEAEHIKEPTYSSTIHLPTAEVSGGSSCPSVPDEDFSGQAEAEVGEILARNDRLIFDGDLWMDNGYREREGKTPEFEEKESKMTDLTCFLLERITIPAEKANGCYPSDGIIRYICSDEKRSPLAAGTPAARRIDCTSGKTFSYEAHKENPEKKYLYYDVDEINPVTVHTPVVCEPVLENKYRDCQLISPSFSHCQLVLGLDFCMQFPSVGQHVARQGYGYREYIKYTNRREVKFPFPVYEVKDGYQYHLENTWIKTGGETLFYLPTWVKEGQYTVSFRAVSINAEPNNSLGQTEEYLNESLNSYVAVKEIPVEVSGRFYGLSVYDISDYPLWQKVFRKNSYSMELSGRRYYVGNKNENGQEVSGRKLVFPFIKGSHPYDSGKGVQKGGYCFRFLVYTIGNMNRDGDSVDITPSFFYLNVETGQKQPVDLYYQETVAGKLQKMVKIGSLLDRKNQKTVRIGSPYLSIPQKELEVTAVLRGMSQRSLMAQEQNVYTYEFIRLRPWLSMLTGIAYQAEHGIPLFDAQDVREVSESVQKWYFEYSLPAHFHIVEKGTDIKKTLKGEAVDFSEEIWLKKGYLLLSFELETREEGERHLSYINPENAFRGYRDMWQQEGFVPHRSDTDQRRYNFSEGDIALFSLRKSTWNEYQSGGTH